MSLLQSLARDLDTWPSPFGDRMRRTVALHGGFTGRRISEEVCCIITDAKTDVLGVVDWKTEATFARPDEVMTPYMEDVGRLPGISPNELTVLVVGILDGSSARPETVLFIGVDNLNADCWIVRGKTSGKSARKLLSALLRLRLGGNDEVAAFYIRTNRNAAARENASLPEDRFHDWGAERT